MNTLKNAKARFENTLMLRMGRVRPNRSDLKNNLKKEAGDYLLEVLGVIIIATVVLVFFRGEIVDFFKNAVSSSIESIKGLFGEISPTK